MNDLIKLIVIVFLVIPVGVIIFMLFWNHLIVEVISCANHINFWQSLGLLAFIALFLGKEIKYNE